ncbi:MAG TPA: dienelactone hydrolase family protein [Candidatus Binatia bacterium]|jgi:carboxymethylenebutenolidase|nr:dienelactone hydrolase family protein [Candidatus Binatia bacterium]
MEIESREVGINASGGTMPAFLCVPKAHGRFPAVLVLMEAFGLTSHIQDVTARIAKEGYVAIVPDLYYRDLPNNKFDYDQVPEGIAMMRRLNHQSVLADIRATLAHLRSMAEVVPSRVGVTGFCMGSGFTFLTACELSAEIAAAAPFYGMVRDEWIEAVKQISVPAYLFFGEADPFIPRERVQQIEARFRELGKSYRIKVYSGADQGFFCHERSSYNQAAAQASWSELTAFFTQHLQRAV